jgi:L-alanine-DL-glutamate epimerase-like enolase superfamily enzyme
LGINVIQSDTSSLESENGEIIVPSVPGSGIKIDPDFIEKHEITTI